MNTISFNDLQRAYLSYRHITKAARNQNTSRQFYKFLGVGEKDNIAVKAYVNGTEVTDEIYQKVNWLLGPNAEALYKAWRIKHVKEQE